MHSQGKANNLNIDLTSQIYQSIDFDQINFDLIYSQKNLIFLMIN